MTGMGSVMFVPYREVADRRRVKGDGDFDLPSGFLARKGLKPDIATERATLLSVSLVGVKVGRRGGGSPRFLSIRPLSEGVREPREAAVANPILTFLTGLTVTPRMD